MGKFNKATAAAIATAVTTVVGTLFVDLSVEFLAAANTVIVTALVWLIPNSEA
jgi:hypothetical protein